MPKRRPKPELAAVSQFGVSGLQWDYTLRPFDRLATEMDEKWGYDRLVELQDAVTAQRWGEVMDELNAAIASGDKARLAEAVAVAMRGLEVMDSKAEAAGHEPPGRRHMLAQVDSDDGAPDFRCLIAQSTAEAVAVKNEFPDYEVYTAREAAVALRRYARTVPMGELRNAFPKAEITDIRPPKPQTDWSHGDDFSFDQEQAK